MVSTVADALLEKGYPPLALVQPILPVLLELIFELGGEIPERHAPRGVEELVAAAAGDREGDTGLSEVVSRRESTLEQRRSVAAEDTLGVPPAGRVHLAVAGDNQAKLEKTIEGDRGQANSHSRLSPPPRSLPAGSIPIDRTVDGESGSERQGQ
jgi:hypothetical protein